MVVVPSPPFFFFLGFVATTPVALSVVEGALVGEANEEASCPVLAVGEALSEGIRVGVDVVRVVAVTSPPFFFFLGLVFTCW